MKRVLIILSFMLILAVSELSYAQVARNSWSFGFGGAFPRFLSTDVRPQEENYGGYISLQRYFSEKVALRIKASYLSMYGRLLRLWISGLQVFFIILSFTVSS